MSVYEYTRDFCRVHLGFRRIATAIAVSIPTIIVGNWLLYFEVSTLDVDEVWAYRLNWPVITFLCFVLNRAFTWSDRENASVLKWIAISVAHSSVSQFAYPQLVSAGMNYMLASALLLSIGPISYLIHSVYTFRREKEVDMA